jgi:hypothetical protein
MQDDVAACLSSSMLQPDMLLPVRACCSPFEHVAAGHIAACSSMLQPVRACCSGTYCRLFEQLQPDMMLPVRACCSGTYCCLFEQLQPDMLPPV